jgi:hypothetical protein
MGGWTAVLMALLHLAVGVLLAVGFRAADFTDFRLQGIVECVLAEELDELVGFAHGFDSLIMSPFFSRLLSHLESTTHAQLMPKRAGWRQMPVVFVFHKLVIT